MAEVIRIPLSVHQEARFNQLRLEAKALTERQSEAVTAIVAGQVDPATLQGWNVELGAHEIVLTPPAEGDVGAGPALVKDKEAE